MPKGNYKGFKGELVLGGDAPRPRGRPTDSPEAQTADALRFAMLNSMARAVIEGASIKSAKLEAATKYRRGVGTLEALWKANREDALVEAAQELIALGRVTRVDAEAAIAKVLSESESRARRRRK